MATANTHFRLRARADQHAFLDLPWGRPLEEWPEEILVDAKRGIGRHVVRFVHVNDAFFALKELPPPLAEREYRLLGELAERAVPAVEAIGLVSERLDTEGGALSDILITRYLDYSLPYRLILGATVLPAPVASIRAALGELLSDCTSPGSSGATARSRTPSSAATRARLRRTSSTRRQASSRSGCRTDSGVTTSRSRKSGATSSTIPSRSPRTCGSPTRSSGPS